jgi:hypothetical protein
MADRVVACVAALVILWLSTQYFELFLLPVRRWPNQPASGNGAVTLLRDAERLSRAVPEQRRWAERCV